MNRNKIAALLALAWTAVPALATNGMNMEGYGPVATGMGGASYAYDNGTAGLINNPATLALMPSGTSRLDLAVGGLHPDVTSKTNGAPEADSDGTAYYMPAVGYVRKDGKLGYGVGLMSQGGMGTEYGTNSFLSGYSSMMALYGAGTSGMSGQQNRSELGVGRVMFPLTYDVSDSFRVGGTLDYVWGGLDIQMVMPGSMFGQFASGASSLGGASGSMVTTLNSFMSMGAVSDVNWAQFDFSEGGNKMKQRLTTNGWAGNIGFVWQATPQLSIGGVYHAKTDLKDMEGNGQVKMNAVMGGSAVTIPISGKMKIVDFQWPETYGIGLAYKANDKVLLVMDYKRIGWKKVMEKFRMAFTADGTQGDPVAQQMVSMGATSLDSYLVQNWKDQDVLMLGGSYQMSEALTLRAGLNVARNPIPSEFVNYLFPAIVKNHVTLGFGYNLSKASSIDFSFAYAPEVSITNDNMGVTTSHSQTNWQFMFSQRF